MWRRGRAACSNGIKAALDEGLSQARGVPLMTVSGKTGKGIDQLLAAAFEIRETWSKRVTTGQLNRWFEDAVEKNPPPAPGGKRIKLRYITQSTRGRRASSCSAPARPAAGHLLRYLVNASAVSSLRRGAGAPAGAASRNPFRRHRQELGFTERRPDCFGPPNHVSYRLWRPVGWP